MNSTSENQLAILEWESVSNFDDYTFQAPFPGYFVGDDHRPRTRGRDMEEFKVLDNTANSSCANQGPSSIGLFDRLPMEIVDEILPYLDVCSLVAFRDINHRTKVIVDSLSMFKIVVSFPGLLHAVLELQCRFFSMEELVRCIRSTKCQYCAHFGDMLYLIIARRICYSCWNEKENVPMIIPFGLENEGSVTTETAIKLYGHVPHIFLSPGNYGTRGDIGFNKPRVAFDQRAFLADPETPSWEVIETTRRPHTLGHMVTIRAPYLEGSTKTWEEGFMCRACAHKGCDFYEWQVWEHEEFYDAWHQWEMQSDSFESWGVPWSRYTIRGMEDHLTEFGGVLKIYGANGRIRYIHEKLANSIVKNSPGLPEISEILRLCRDKVIRYPQLTIYSAAWNSVSSIRRTKEEMIAESRRKAAEAQSTSQVLEANN